MSAAPQRILFLDDEMAILRGLERALRPRRAEWECRFVDDPVDALRVVESFQPDAVVSDMLMPGLDGAEFLSEASRRQPVMARIVLSGEVGAGSLARMAAAAHQCLAKPCRADVLIEVLRHTLPERGSARLAALQPALFQLPGLPVAAETLAALRWALAASGGPGRDDYAIDLISRAPGIAAKLLQVATWTALGTRTPPTHVREAFHQLGVDAVRSLLESELFPAWAAGGAAPFQPSALAHCARASELAAAIARSEQCTRDAAEEIELVTLMGAAAPLLLDVLSRADYDAVRAEAAATAVPRHRIEQQWFGMPGAQFMARLLRLWGLAPSLAAWVERGDDLDALSAARSAADVISFAARALTDPDGPEARRADLEALATRLGASDGLAAWAALARPAAH